MEGSLPGAPMASADFAPMERVFVLVVVCSNGCRGAARGGSVCYFWWAGVEVNGGALPHADYCLLAGWSRVWGMDESGCELGCVLRWALSLEYCRVLAASGAGIGVGVEKAKWSA